MKRIATHILTVLLFSSINAFGSDNEVIIKKDANGGYRVQCNKKDFFINGMNWDYFPVGTNYTYNLWKQSEDYIKNVLDYEMGMLKNIGVNAIRQYTGVPAKWIKYIYEQFGIYTVLNHSFGRYGLNVKGINYPNTDYANKDIRAYLLSDVLQMAQEYKHAPGLLMFLLGNENNYGLFWNGAETENIPTENGESNKQAYHLYTLFNLAAKEIKKNDKAHPVAICNGDLQFMKIISRECKDIDVLGINVYRGLSFGDLFKRVRTEFNKPVMLTEFGADAFNVQKNAEDQEFQAKCLKSNWKEIYANAAGLGLAGNSIGGFTFQFSDGWWKTGQTKGLNEHDSTASWANGGYFNDYKTNSNNMNEEWFGVCAKEKMNDKGFTELKPRLAYYALKEIHQLEPYKQSKLSKKQK